MVEVAVGGVGLTHLPSTICFGGSHVCDWPIDSWTCSHPVGSSVSLHVALIGKLTHLPLIMLSWWIACYWWYLQLDYMLVISGLILLVVHKWWSVNYYLVTPFPPLPSGPPGPPGCAIVSI